LSPIVYQTIPGAVTSNFHGVWGKIIPPNKSFFDPDGNEYFDDLCYVYYSLYDGVFLVNEVVEGGGEGNSMFCSTLMDSNNTSDERRYVNVGKRLHCMLPNGLIVASAFEPGTGYGIVELLDIHANPASVQLDFDYGPIRFSHMSWGDIQTYFISSVDYFIEQELYYAFYGKTGSFREYVKGDYVFDMMDVVHPNRQMGIALFDKEGHLIDMMELPGVYCYELETGYLNHGYNSLKLYDAFTDDGTFLIRNKNDYQFFLVNIQNRFVVNIDENKALEFLQNIDSSWKKADISFNLDDFFIREIKLEHDFSIKYTVEGTHVYDSGREIASFQKDYVLAFLTQDIDGSYYLMFKKESELPDKTFFIHPYNEAHPPIGEN